MTPTVSSSHNVSVSSSNIQLDRNDKDHVCLYNVTGKCYAHGCQVYEQNRKKDDLSEMLLDVGLGRCHGPQLGQVSSVAYVTSKIQSSVTPATFSPDTMLFSSSSDPSLFLPPSSSSSSASSSQAPDLSLPIAPPTPLLSSSQPVRQPYPTPSPSVPVHSLFTSASQVTTPLSSRAPPSLSNSLSALLRLLLFLLNRWFMTGLLLLPLVLI